MLHNHLSSGADTIGQLVVNVPSGLILTAPPKNYTNINVAGASGYSMYTEQYYFRCPGN
jgi:hypothetical protein